MFIKQITIEGVEGDVEILHIDVGALITSGNKILCEVRRDEDSKARFAKAEVVAKVICGQSHNRGKTVSLATTGMAHDVMNEIDRVAGI